MVEALIFDCDGTLTDSMPLHFLAWREVMQRVNIEFTEERFYELAGMPGDKVLSAIAGDSLSEAEKHRLLQERESLFFDSLEKVQPIIEVVNIAREHKDRFPMAVASGSIRESVDRQLTSIGILDWFQVTVTAEDTELHKPEPDVFLEAARRLGVKPQACRVYEDSDFGIEAARRAGMELVDVRPLYRK